MALIKCKECGGQMSSSARVCPHCGKQRPSAVNTGCAWIVVVFGAFVVWAIWQGASNVGGSASSTALVSTPSTAVTPPPAAAPILQRWNYRQSVDDMTGKPIHSAVVQSQNTVDFSFPYAGAQHATLIVRKHPRYGLDVILSIERGQFGCGVDGCDIMVRFDDGKALRYTGAEPESHRTTGVFISPAARFDARLHKAKVVRVESSFYQEGRQVFVFDVSGFDDKAFGGG